ncbi:MAG TPA: Gfo/Idh/MocA family oxidoreductase, partial [Phycisphaerae bacterium]|nr:Gfo/Idh/MocA family oxidoreductase [Phycisphaerae bacterium]
MSRTKLNRRTFLRNGVAAGAAAMAVSRMSAAGAARVIGANDRINVGIIGCGARGRWLIMNSIQVDSKGVAIVAACDVFKSRLEEYRSDREKALGLKPKAYQDYRKLLDDGDIDAVVIATPDHQHCGMGCDAIQAGKHAYIEKPLPGLVCDLPELNTLHDTVKKSKLAVQIGTQGASCLGAQAIKKAIAEGKLGKLFRVESTETLHIPYWMNYKGPATEAETDWKAWLYNRPSRPFDAKLHAMWMGYSEITSGTIGGWMSHFVNLVHFVTGCGFPKSAVAWGGRYAPTNDPDCTCPDQTDVVLEYADGFHTQFTSHFGSDIDNEKTLFMFENGSIRCK